MKGVERGYKRDEDLSKGRHSSKTKKTVINENAKLLSISSWSLRPEICQEFLWFLRLIIPIFKTYWKLKNLEKNVA